MVTRVRVEVGAPLTDDENRMMALLASGEKVGKIATALGYEVSTVHHRLKAVEKKLGVGNRVAAMAVWSLLQPRFVTVQRPIRCRGVVIVRDLSGAKAYAQCENTIPCSAEHVE